jgi:hypothetical protein
MHNHLPPSLRLATLAAVSRWFELHRHTQNVEGIAEREVIRRQNGIGAEKLHWHAVAPPCKRMSCEGSRRVSHRGRLSAGCGRD